MQPRIMPGVGVCLGGVRPPPETPGMIQIMQSGSSSRTEEVHAFLDTTRSRICRILFTFSEPFRSSFYPRLHASPRCGNWSHSFLGIQPRVGLYLLIADLTV